MQVLYCWLWSYTRKSSSLLMESWDLCCFQRIYHPKEIHDWSIAVDFVYQCALPLEFFRC